MYWYSQHDSQPADLIGPTGRKTQGFPGKAEDQKDAPAAKGNGVQPSLNILAQYVKDLSFESPGAPGSLRARDKAPNNNIGVNVNANPLSDKEFDVVLTLSAKAEMRGGPSRRASCRCSP